MAGAAEPRCIRSPDAQGFDGFFHILPVFIVFCQVIHPQVFEQGFFPLIHPNPALAGDQRHGHLDFLRRLGGGFDGQGFRVAFVVCVAKGPQGTNFAVRGAGGADCCSQIHQRLIEIPATGVGHVLPAQIGQAALHGGNVHVLPDTMKAGQHPGQVAVHGGGGDIESDGGHCGGGVIPHAGQSAQLFQISREHSAILFHNRFRRLVQVPGAGIVPQPFPAFEHVLLRRARQGKHVREAINEAGVVPRHRFGAGLLEHDLADPDAIGVLRAPEGQHALVRIIPGKQQGGKHGFASIRKTGQNVIPILPQNTVIGKEI